MVGKPEDDTLTTPTEVITRRRMHRVLATAFAALAITGCGDDDAKPAEPDYPAAILTQDGFDFSRGAVPAARADSDGDTVAWAPSPSLFASGNDGELWFRAAANDAQTSFIRDMGDALLGSIKEAPTAWDGGAGVALPPLQKDHAYVVKCLDGFAKFKIGSIDSGVAGWPVAVDYDYSAVSTFDR
ncbi:MAG: hypothetical protein V3T05_02125 [Myxococcota bacterium]